MAAGVDLEDPKTVIGSSPLRRARRTASLLFDTRSHLFAHFGENGAINENTRTDGPYQPPNWDAFMKSVRALNRRTVVVVGHGSFLGTVVWPAVSKECLPGRNGRVQNLDAFVVRGSFNNRGTLTVASTDYLPYTGRIKPDSSDSCQVKKVAATTRMTRRQQGGYNMPLSYFKDGAQMQGTVADESGVGLGPSMGWAREPLTQTGGYRSQNGGWSPSVMGAFATTGMRLAPVAAYVGYKMWKNFKNSKKTRKHRHQNKKRKSGTRRK